MIKRVYNRLTKTTALKNIRFNASSDYISLIDEIKFNSTIGVPPTEIERIWLTDSVNYYIPKVGLEDIPTDKMLLQYAKTFNWLLNISYCPKKEKAFYIEDILKHKYIISMKFGYIEDKPEITIQEIDDDCSMPTDGISIDFPNNRIYITKPNCIKHWLRSQADLGAGECFAMFGENVYKKERK